MAGPTKWQVLHRLLLALREHIRGFRDGRSLRVGFSLIADDLAKELGVDSLEVDSAFGQYIDLDRMILSGVQDLILSVGTDGWVWFRLPLKSASQVLKKLDNPKRYRKMAQRMLVGMDWLEVAEE